MFAGKKSAQIREILISESAWEEMTCLFAPSKNDIFPAWLILALSPCESEIISISSLFLPSAFLSFVSVIIEWVHIFVFGYTKVYTKLPTQSYTQCNTSSQSVMVYILESLLDKGLA